MSNLKLYYEIRTIKTFFTAYMSYHDIMFKDIIHLLDGSLKSREESRQLTHKKIQKNKETQNFNKKLNK